MRVGCLLLIVGVFLAVPALSQDTESLPIGQRFHLETSFGDEGSKTLDPQWGESLPAFKIYDGAETFALPSASDGKLTVEDAIAARKSVRSFSDAPLPLAHLTRVFLSAYGITQPRGDVGRRGVPSAGGLYPMELYLVAANVESLPAGIYHFRPADTTLEFLLEGDFSLGVYEASNRQRSAESAPATLIIAARFDRTTQKYADRGYRYVYIEAGAVCQNIYLQAGALGMGTCAVGAFNDDALSALLDIDGIDEAPLLIMPLGFPSGS